MFIMAEIVSRDYWSWRRHSIRCFRDHDLKTSIENLLIDHSLMAKNRQEFVAEYLYGIDGKSSERIADLIKDVISRTS